MKKLIISIFIFIVFADFAKAQTYILFDRRWYKPAVLTDSVTRMNLSDGWFPIYKNELDSLITLVDKLKDLRKDGLERKFFFSEDFKTEHLVFEIENIKRAYGDGYEINLISTGPYGSNTLKLSDPKLLLTDKQKVIRVFLSYIKRAKKDIYKPVKGKKNNTKNNPFID